MLLFGGELFLYCLVFDFIEDDLFLLGCKFFFIINVILFIECVKESFEVKEILGMVVFFDVVMEKSFDILCLCGRKVSWDDVLDSLVWFWDFKKKNDFVYFVSMMLNSVNYDEIERFVDFGLCFDVEFDILFVANFDQIFVF